jgi:hypothetical protein
MPHDPLPFSPPPPTEEPQGPTPEQVGVAARAAIMETLDLLDQQGTPLSTLLARQALTRPDKLLMACARFAPNMTKQDLLPTIQAMHLQAVRALSRQPVIIDQRDDDWLA